MAALLRGPLERRLLVDWQAAIECWRWECSNWTRCGRTWQTQEWNSSRCFRRWWPSDVLVATLVKRGLILHTVAVVAVVVVVVEEEGWEGSIQGERGGLPKNPRRARGRLSSVCLMAMVLQPCEECSSWLMLARCCSKESRRRRNQWMENEPWLRSGEAAAALIGLDVVVDDAVEVNLSSH